MRSAQTIVEEIVKNRGITDREDLEEYFSDSPRKTYDPFDMMNMKDGVDLIMDNIADGRTICIYGDYDADGVTSVCTLYQGLSHLTDRLSWYIPSRFTEGYGVSIDAIEKMASEGIGLIITVDCGITSVKEARRAKELGVDLLITDHHTPGDELPECIVIDPKQDNETYPFKNLAGCGVAFKMLQAIQRRADLPKSVVSNALDLVGAGTVGDIVPLVDENRTIVKYGLRKLNTDNRKSIKALADAISIDEIRSENISFGIVPHINAAGRMGDAGDAVKLFLSEDDDTIRTQVDKLVNYNSARRRVQDEAYKKCVDNIDGNEDIIVLRMDGIHEGIAGVVAGKIKDSSQRPVIITTSTENDLLKGTGRSISGLDIYSLLKPHEDQFIKFGGHKSACGFTMKKEGFSDLKKALEEDVRSLYEEDPDLISGKAEYEMEIEPAEITFELADRLLQMEPYGEGNPAPVFAVRNVDILNPRYMGADGTHVRFKAVKDGASVECVLFRRAAELSSLIESDTAMDLFGSIKTQIWNGEKRIQFIIKEIESGRKQDN